MTFLKQGNEGGVIGFDGVTLVSSVSAESISSPDDGKTLTVRVGVTLLGLVENAGGKRNRVVLVTIGADAEEGSANGIFRGVTGNNESITRGRVTDEDITFENADEVVESILASRGPEERDVSLEKIIERMSGLGEVRDEALEVVNEAKENLEILDCARDGIVSELGNFLRVSF
jgi:hypothetical protein